MKGKTYAIFKMKLQARKSFHMKLNTLKTYFRQRVIVIKKNDNDKKE